MKKLEDIALKTLIGSIAILTLLAVLAIWDVLSRDVLGKSLSTIGVIAFSSFIILLASRMVESHNNNAKDDGEGHVQN